MTEQRPVAYGPLFLPLLLPKQLLFDAVNASHTSAFCASSSMLLSPCRSRMVYIPARETHLHGLSGPPFTDF